MKLYFFSLLTFFFLLLSDPEGSGSCGGCNSYLSEVGVLPDTTLTIGSTWEVVIIERLWEENESCEMGYYGPNTPQVTAYTSNSNIEVIQQNSLLLFKAKKQGTTDITLVAGVSGDIEPEILSQTIQVTVK